MKYHFKISGRHHDALKKHLYPGDKKEAVCLAICGRNNSGDIFFVHELLKIPHESCYRDEDYVNWPTTLLEKELPKIVKRNQAVFKIHSHPGGFNKFSKVDDKSDLELFESLYGWFDGNILHGSLVLLPNDIFFGRIVTPDLKFKELDKITIVDRFVKVFDKNQKDFDEDLNLRNSQTLGEGTQKLLKNLKVGVVGCSGTGSPVVEQLARLGVGELVLIDPDIVEFKNLNRILNATKDDADSKLFKVDVAKRSILKMGFSTIVTTFDKNLYDSQDAVISLSSCDFIFGCMDSIDGRHILNAISNFYLIPYIDIGVKILSDKRGGLEQICGTVHYILPGMSSLMTRGVYDHEMLRASNMLRSDVKEYEKQIKSGYITDINVEAPAVISINMFAASIAVNEFLSRFHNIKTESLNHYDIIRFSLTDFYILNEESSNDTDQVLLKYIGRGDISPLLNMPELSHVG